MAKARIYGIPDTYNQKQWRPLRHPKKYRPRPREIKTTGPVAGRAAATRANLYNDACLPALPGEKEAGE